MGCWDAAEWAEYILGIGFSFREISPAFVIFATCANFLYQHRGFGYGFAGVYLVGVSAFAGGEMIVFSWNLRSAGTSHAVERSQSCGLVMN